MVLAAARPAGRDVGPNDEVYASVAYILSLNGIIKDTDVLNRDKIMKVQMPNRDGFIDLYPGKF
jgi:cytochrome c